MFSSLLLVLPFVTFAKNDLNLNVMLSASFLTHLKAKKTGKDQKMLKTSLHVSIRQECTLTKLFLMRFISFVESS